jgi:beta-galactosidase
MTTPHQESPPSRRTILRAGLLSSAVLAPATQLPLTRGHPANPPGQVVAGLPAPAAGSYEFNQNWLFGGTYTAGSEHPGYNDSGFAGIAVPHTVRKLSWGNWKPAGWEQVWIYRKHFTLGKTAGSRVFADFDGVMVNATVVLNGKTVATHKGGYLPFSAELTHALADGRNLLAVIVDSRWLPVPPGGSEAGPESLDYLQPGGIYRDVRLRVVPEVFVADVFAKPVAVLTSSRRVQVEARIEAGAVPAHPATVTATLLDGQRAMASATTSVKITRTGSTTVRLTLPGIGGVTLWSPSTPKLYTVAVTLRGPASHQLEVTTGFREAVFRPDGFWLNGKRLKIFGLNRHQLFPYTGMAAPARLQRRDAEILKYELNCNMVRCSHYPQSPHFLDACDELGLMVWEEAPGWQYVGGAQWQDTAVANMHDMVVRDRNRPSVIVWAARLNEAGNHPRLYARNRRLAHQLDGTRQTTGAMRTYSTSGWAEDVFAYNDYHSSGGDAVLKPPLPHLPYLVSEAVGALDGAPVYRWADPGAVLARQALQHAQVHQIARSDQRYAGLLGWAAIDYASLRGGDRIWDGLKTAGVLDVFRVPKPGAALYRSQLDPAVRPVIAPAFFWDFGPGSPEHGPGRGAMIATNCDRLEIFAGSRHLATGRPDRHRFGSLRHPPVFANLTVGKAPHHPDLHIHGYVGTRQVVTLSMSADRSRDRLALTADDTSIEADGSDATRLTFRAVDAFGNPRPQVGGQVTVHLAGPATLIGDNPFSFGHYGGVGGAFIRSHPGQAGTVTVTARHASLGQASARVTVVPPSRGRNFL